MYRNKTVLTSIILIAIVTAASLYLLQPKASRGKSSLVVSTTTSLFDTGILDEIEKEFESKNEIDLYFISVGTGLAITHAKRGDADMILVHDPSREFSFMEEGYGVCRKIIAYNFFAIVGPQKDPASIKELSPTEALKKILDEGRAGRSLWVSRGDDSGTHTKEKSLWASAGFSVSTVREERWYREAGTGMGKTLQIAEEFGAYTLTDMGTYLKYIEEELITLDILVGAGQELINVYSAIAVNPVKNPEANFQEAVSFIGYLVSEEGQSIFERFGLHSYGTSLFNPAVKFLKTGFDLTTSEWIEESAFFEGSECPERFRADQSSLYD